MRPFPGGGPSSRMEYPDRTKRTPMGERLVEMVRAELAGFCTTVGASVELREGLFHLQFGDVAYVLSNDGLSSERMHLTLGAFLRGRAVGAPFAAVLANVHGLRRVLATGKRLRELLSIRPVGSGVVVEVRDGAFLFGEEKTGWRTSYDYATWVEPLARVEARGLPFDDTEAVRVLQELSAAIVAPAPAAPVNRGGTCRFCGGTFEARDYLLHERCCHGCAVSRLGVVF